MRGWGVFVILAANLAGQPAAPIGIVRGELVRRDTGESGRLTVRTLEQRVFSFEYDARTVVERGGDAARVAELPAGVLVEILSDAGSSPETRYARTVKTIPHPATPQRAPVRRSRLRSSPLPENPFPRGRLNFSGAVTSVAADRIALRLRGGGEKVILLRTDTRFLKDGVPVEGGGLPVNARVFVRAGPALNGQVEAFEVVWGGILKPN